MSKAKGRRISEVALSCNGAHKTQQSNAFTAVHKVNHGMAIAEWHVKMEHGFTNTSPGHSVQSLI